MTPVSSRLIPTTPYLPCFKTKAIANISRLFSIYRPESNRCPQQVIQSDKFGPLLKKPDLLFYSIFNAVWEMPSISQRGIWEGNFPIRCARSPSHPDSQGCGGTFGSIRSGIVFAIEGVSGRNAQRKDDVVLVSNWIYPSNILAAIINEKMLETPLSALNFFEEEPTDSFVNRCKTLDLYLKEKHCIADPTLDSILQKHIDHQNREEIKKRCNELFKSVLQKQWDMNAPRESLHLVRHLAPSLKLFDSNGFRL